MMVERAEALSREIALRLTLAARSLPETDPRELAAALARQFGSPLTPEKLSGITVEALFRALRGPEEVPDPAQREPFKQAVRVLWGEDSAEAATPCPEPYTDGEMPASLRVAVASNQGELADGHFGSCSHFLVYQVSRTAAKLIEVRTAWTGDGAADRNAARAQLVADCHLVYVQSIGGPAAAKVVRAGVHPIKWARGGQAREAIQVLQAALASPPPWLARAMGVADPRAARWSAVEEV